MTIGRSIPRYGRIEVGQRVRFERVMPAPTPKRATLGRGVETVTIRTEHPVDEIRPCDSGVFVMLRHADGQGEIRACFDSYGQCWGGFGGLEVLADAPLQLGLHLNVGANRAAEGGPVERPVMALHPKR